jgi:putative membrane protein
MALSIKVSLVSATVAFAAALGCNRSDSTSELSSPEAGGRTTVAVAAADAGATMGPMPVTALSADGGSVVALLYGGDAGASTALAYADAGANTAQTDALGEPLTDAKIVAIVSAANGGELEQANVALARGSSDKVKMFAQHMVKDHTQAGKDLTDLASKKGLVSQESTTSRKLEVEGKALLADLHAKSTGVDFDRDYMNAQVKEHQDLLTALDNRLIPQAKDDQLVSLLKKVRAKVAHHLKMARDIDSSIGS